MQSIDKILADTDVSLSVLEVLADNSFDSIIVTDPNQDGTIVYANKAFGRLTGYDPSEVVGQTPRILQGQATDKKVLSRLSAAMQEQGTFEGKAINYKKDGTPFIMHWRVVPVMAGGTPKAWLAIQREGSAI